LIVCKNVLLHLNEDQRRDVLRMFHANLRSDGMLAVEHTQKMPETLRPPFHQAVANAQVYKKLEIPVTAAGGHTSGSTRRVDLPTGRPVPLRGLEIPVLSGG